MGLTFYEGRHGGLPSHITHNANSMHPISLQFGFVDR
jgi:hypothetical protein